MSKVKRITPDEVLEAYEETGLLPEQCEWAFEHEDGSRCACGLGAIYSNRVEEGFETLGNTAASEFDLIEDVLGLSRPYMYGFISGFDKTDIPFPIRENDREEAERGHSDGRAAWEAVKHLAKAPEPADQWLRVRFFQPSDDYRPIKWPPVGPYWCSGYRGSDNAACIVAFVKSIDQVREYWPEADDIDQLDEPGPIYFTDRFPRPDWWDGE